MRVNNLVSVVLPVRNGEKYIRDAIESILAQTYPHFELVVVDASDDNTPNIVASYKDRRIKYFRQKSKGSVNGYNEALDNYVEGRYVTFIHHDDLYYAEKLYEQIRIIEKFADVDCVYNDVEFVDESLNTIRLVGHEDFYHRTDDLFVIMIISHGVSNLGMSTLIKRDFIEKHKLRYSLDTPVCCDHTYMFDLVDSGAVFKHISKPLLKYRVHEDNYSSDRERVEQEIQKIYKRYSLEFLREVVARTNYSEAEREIIEGRLYYRLGHVEMANRYFFDVWENHSNPWAAFYLGTAYYRFQGNFASAEQWLRRGREEMPYRAEFANNIGCCILQREGPMAAKPFFAEAARLMPDYYDAKYNLNHIEKGEQFNPRMTDREIERPINFNIVWKDSEKKREESGSLQPAGCL